eukprot:CAMPEP_0206149120 /NCGR_PEP_ID=MMETSP1473-20131121/37614_1 /ASSEMBLY_ACC=CAM_ASM_001109 /TAXON_ID=1461547 /ORGANISM="Stichococcus sp, Strain RCC1054" /LENGTH=127 /DNA_ID=CAMNT_0053546565 /DNA_START=559 /DNA_END=942 /DNA_ORIENTATION=+
MAMESESHKLDEAVVGPGVEAVLRDPSKGRFFIAEVDGEQAAQLLITFEWSDWRNASYFWIQSVHTVKEHRRKGCFRALYNHVKMVAVAEQAAGVRLYADMDNARANATYEALGMTSHYKVYEQLFK